MRLLLWWSGLYSTAPEYARFLQMLLNVLVAASGADALRLSQELEALRLAEHAAARIDLLLTE